MKTYVPEVLHSKLRFVATLRHPVPRDLSWFNVLNQKKSSVGTNVVVVKEDTERDYKAALQAIDTLTQSEDAYITNEAGIRTIRMPKLKKLCVSLNSSACYSIYSKFALNSYNICKKTVLSPAGAILDVLEFSEFKNLISAEIKATQGLAYFALKDVYWEEAFLYSKCYKSSIFRTGLLINSYIYLQIYMLLKYI